MCDGAGAVDEAYITLAALADAETSIGLLAPRQCLQDVLSVDATEIVAKNKQAIERRISHRQVATVIDVASTRSCQCKALREDANKSPDLHLLTEHSVPRKPPTLTYEPPMLIIKVR